MTPVIGIILIVAVTTILAGIAGFYVLDSGSPQSPAPDTRFDFEYSDSGDLTISHAGGDTIESDNTFELEVRYTDASGDQTEQWSLPVRSGSELTLPTAPQPGTEVRVIWTGPDGEATDVLARDTA